MQAHIRNYLRHFKIGETDTWQCEMCMKQLPINNGLQIHHIKYRSHGGGDEVENCICLCVKHHSMCHDEKISKDEVLYIHRNFMLGVRKVFVK